MMGFVILGHRLYKMKKKTKGLELKVAVDDKVTFQYCCVSYILFFLVARANC